MITLTLLQSLGKDYLQSDHLTFSSPHHSQPKASNNFIGLSTSRQQTLISQISPKNQRGQIQNSKFPTTKGSSSDQTQIQQQQLQLQRRYVDFNNQQLQKQQKIQICKLLSSQIQQLDTQLSDSCSYPSTPNFNQQRGQMDQMMRKDPRRDNLELVDHVYGKEQSKRGKQMSIKSPKAVSSRSITKVFSPVSFKEESSKTALQSSKKSTRQIKQTQEISSNQNMDTSQRESYEEFYKLFPQDLSIRNSYQAQNDYYQRQQQVPPCSDKIKHSNKSAVNSQELRRVGSKTQRHQNLQLQDFGVKSPKEIDKKKSSREISLKSPRINQNQNLRYSSRSSQKKSKGSKEAENQSQSLERGVQQNVNLIYTQHLRNQIIQQQKQAQEKGAQPAKRVASRSTEKQINFLNSSGKKLLKEKSPSDRVVSNQLKQGYHTKQPSMKNQTTKDPSPSKRSSQTEAHISRNQGPQIYSNTFQQQQIQLEDLRTQLKEQRSPKVFSYGNTLTLNQQERSPISSNWTNHYIKQSQKQRERSPILSSSQSSQLKFKKLHAKQKSREVQSIAQLLSSPISEEGVKLKDGGSLKKNVIEFMKKQTQQPSQKNAKQSQQPLIYQKAYQKVSQFTIVDSKTSRNNALPNEKKNNSAAVFMNKQTLKEQKQITNTHQIKMARQSTTTQNFNQKTSKSQVQIKVTGKNKSPKKNSQQVPQQQTNAQPARGMYESLFQKVYRVTQEQLSSNMSLASSQHQMELDFQLFSDKILDSQTENQRYREESDLQEFMDLERNLSSDKLRISNQFQQSQDERRQTVSSETPTLKKAENQIISANEMKDIAHKRSSTWQIQSQDMNQRTENERLAEVKSNYFSQEQFLSSDNQPKSTQSQDRGSDGNNYSIFNLQSKQPSISKGSHFKVPSIDFQSQNQQLQVSQLDIPSNDISSINNSQGSIKQQHDLHTVSKIPTQNQDSQLLKEKQDYSSQALRLFQTNQNHNQFQSLIQKAEELKRKFVQQQQSTIGHKQQEQEPQLDKSSDISKQDSFTLQISADDEGQGLEAEVSLKLKQKKQESRPLSKTGTQTSSMNTSSDVNHNCVVISINHISSEESQGLKQGENIQMISEEDIIHIQNPICLESPRTNLDQQDQLGFEIVNSMDKVEIEAQQSLNDYHAYLKGVPSIPALVPSERLSSQCLGRDSKGSSQRNRDMPLQISCLKKPCLVSKDINHDERILFSIRDRKSSAKKRVTINLEQNEFNEFERPSSCSEIEVSQDAKQQMDNYHSFEEEEESQEEIISQNRDLHEKAQSHHFYEQYDNEKLREEFLRLQLQKFDSEILQQRKQATHPSKEEAPFSFERVDEKLFIQNSLAKHESEMLKEETHQSTEQTFSMCDNQLQSVDPRALETLYQYADILRESQESPYEMREEDDQNVTISFRQHAGYIKFEQRTPEEGNVMNLRNSENDKSIVTQEESLELPLQMAPQMLQPNPLDIEVMQLTQQLHNYSSHSSLAQVIVSAVSPAKDRIRQVLRNRVSPMQLNQQNKIEFRRNAVSHLLKESAAEQHLKVQSLSHFLSNDEPLRVSAKVDSKDLKEREECHTRQQEKMQKDQAMHIDAQLKANDHSLQSIEINKIPNDHDTNLRTTDESSSTANFKPLSSRIESFTRKYIENQQRIQESLGQKTSRPKASDNLEQKQNFELTRGILNSHRTNKQIYI